jgi:hypothetical protein
MLEISIVRNGVQSQHGIRNRSGLGAPSPQLFSVSGILPFPNSLQLQVTR